MKYAEAVAAAILAVEPRARIVVPVDTGTLYASVPGRAMRLSIWQAGYALPRLEASTVVSVQDRALVRAVLDALDRETAEGK